MTQKIDCSFLKIITGSEISSISLPIMKAQGSDPGPKIWLTSCSHGDEIGTIVIIQELFKRLKKSPLLKGTIYSFPLMNPIGFETSSRDITLSEEDLNRSFPGDKNGSFAERIAFKIFSTIKETKPRLVIDLHNDWTNSIPYCLVDVHPGKQNKLAYKKAGYFAERTGFLVVKESIESIKNDNLDRTLSFSLLNQDIPSLTLELGESSVVNEKNVEHGVNSIWNILMSLNMVEKSELFEFPLLNIKGKKFKYSSYPHTSKSGIIRFTSRPGDFVLSGQTVAKVYSIFGTVQESISALKDGIVLGYSDSAVSFPGTPVMAFAYIV